MAERRPGFGLAAAAPSIAFSRPATHLFKTAASGLGAPSGGIDPPRTFRMAFSHTSACCATFVMPSVSNIRPAVFSLWLWQVAEDLPTRGGDCALNIGRPT